jgi:hypothetical protein
MEIAMRILILFISAISFTALSSAADIENGGELHAENCTACHDSAMYTRENRFVQSLANLGTQVRFCKDNLGITWFDDEVDDVVGFLNQNYYHY